MGAGGSAGKIFATMLLVAAFILFNLICNMIMTFLAQPKGQGTGMGPVGKIFATMLLHFVIPFNLLCNMTIF